MSSDFEGIVAVSEMSISEVFCTQADPRKIFYSRIMATSCPCALQWKYKGFTMAILKVNIK